jgi:hypothetical protein
MKRFWLIPLAAFVPAVLLAQAAPAPPVSINQLSRTAQATPNRIGFTHTGGGNLDVQQPSPDTLVATLTGVAVAGGHPCKHSLAELVFDLEQCFEVSFDRPGVKAAKLTIEGRLIGLLRSHCKGGGAAEVSGAVAAVSSGTNALLTLALPEHFVAGGENLSVNDRATPFSVIIQAGTYALHQKLHIRASHPKSILPFKAASAEFAPDPALDPLWISAFEPFHGASKKDFGFQITIKVAAEEAKEEAKKDVGQKESPADRAKPEK